MASVLVSGAPCPVAGVSAVLKDLDADVTEVTDLAEIPATCRRADVTTTADREARHALIQVLARAARADASRIAAFAVGRVPTAAEPIPDRMAELSLDDWRVEMMNVMYADT